MANSVARSPLRIEESATIWAAGTSPRYVQLMQWVDNAADIANDSSLVLTINGTQVLTAKLALTADTINNAVVWEMNFSGKPMLIESLVVTTIDKGELIIWLA